MPTATLSTKGQIVIPLEVRREAGLGPGERLTVEYDKTTGVITMSRRETLHDMAQRFTTWIDPATPLLESASDFYAVRRPERP